MSTEPPKPPETPGQSEPPEPPEQPDDSGTEPKRGRSPSPKAPNGTKQRWSIRPGRLRSQASLPSLTTLWERSEAENRNFATRFAGQLLLFGAALGLFLILVLGVREGLFSAGWFAFVGACAIAAIWGLIYILLPHPVPDAILVATPAGAAILITASLAVNHSAADGMLLLTWPVLFAAYLLPRRTAYWTLAVAIICLTIVLTQGTGPGRFSAWLETSASMVLTVVVILQVRGQADRLKQALAEQASTDPLTGLGNRRVFDEALARETARQRRTGTPLSLLVVDVDYFKMVNDTWGHAAGDDALAALGELLPRLVRASDTVCRIGGEEFGVLMPDCPPNQAVDRADALRAAVRAASNEWPHALTVSVGVSTMPDSAEAMRDLVIAADTALYAAKESGRDRVSAAPPRRHTS